jgi:hypothetical protein
MMVANRALSGPSGRVEKVEVSSKPFIFESSFSLLTEISRQKADLYWRMAKREMN